MHPFMFIEAIGLKLPVIFEPSVLFDTVMLTVVASVLLMWERTGKNKQHTSVVLCLYTKLAVFCLLLMLRLRLFRCPPKGYTTSQSLGQNSMSVTLNPRNPLT